MAVDANNGALFRPRHTQTRPEEEQFRKQVTQGASSAHRRLRALRAGGHSSTQAIPNKEHDQQIEQLNQSFGDEQKLNQEQSLGTQRAQHKGFIIGNTNHPTKSQPEKANEIQIKSGSTSQAALQSTHPLQNLQNTNQNNNYEMRHSLLANDSEQNLSFCNDEQFQKEQDEQVNSKFAIEDDDEVVAKCVDDQAEQQQQKQQLRHSMPYGSMFNQNTNSKALPEPSESGTLTPKSSRGQGQPPFQNCFGISSNSGPFNLEDSSNKYNSNTTKQNNNTISSSKNERSAAVRQTANKVESNHHAGQTNSDVFYNPFSSFGHKNQAPAAGGGENGTNRQGQFDKAMMESSHFDQNDSIDEQQGTSVAEPAFGGAINSNLGINSSNLYYRTNQAYRNTAAGVINALDFNPFAAAQSYMTATESLIGQNPEDRLRILGIQKLQSKKKNYSMIEGASTTIELYYNNSQRENGDGQDETHSNQAKQFQPLYTKLIAGGKGIVQKQSKSNMGNKIYQRQGFEFQSVLKERASQARQRLTMGHKTPLQRRLLIKNQVYDQIEKEQSQQFPPVYTKIQAQKTRIQSKNNRQNLNLQDQVPFSAYPKSFGNNGGAGAQKSYQSSTLIKKDSETNIAPSGKINQNKTIANLFQQQQQSNQSIKNQLQTGPIPQIPAEQIMSKRKQRNLQQYKPKTFTPLSATGTAASQDTENVQKQKLTFQELKKQIAFGSESVDMQSNDIQQPGLKKEKKKIAQTWGFGS